MAGISTFNWEDPLDLEASLTEDERMICDAARSYAQDKLAPRVLEAFRHENTDPAIFREMGELGLLVDIDLADLNLAASSLHAVSWIR